MSITKLNKILTNSVADLKAKGSAKGDEMVITGMKPATGEKSVRYFVEGYGDKEFVKMNSNSYL
ncbi:MAG: pyridoxal phosphate-dependent aminotransferase family protein, partial [Candidatus Marinimicrobia bacterium]|nr:pyridoxal phosphate-dependent aminotransferase family protein [Candidatus Neomarinimicrobiota bacterium]